jgi:hypothetical protein
LKEVSLKTLSCRRCKSCIVEHILLRQEASDKVCSADSLLEKDEGSKASHGSQHVEQAGRLGRGAVVHVLSYRREWLSVKVWLRVTRHLYRKT